MFRTQMLFCAVTMAVLCLLVAPAPADTITLDVSDDGYLPVGMGNWYWDKDYAKSYNNLFGMGYYCYGFAKFDLAGLAGLSADDVFSAVFVLNVTGKQGAGADPYPAGTDGLFSINAYDDTVMLDESYVGAVRPGYVPGTTVTKTYGAGPETWFAVDITDIVKDWVNGDYVNNGIEIFDGLEDDYGWYWGSKEAPSGTPFLRVETASVPEPGTMLLLGTGLVGMLGYIRRRRMS